MSRLVHDDGWRPNRDDVLILVTALAIGLMLALLIGLWFL